jgi:hypothetical protein
LAHPDGSDLPATSIGIKQRREIADSNVATPFRDFMEASAIANQIANQLHGTERYRASQATMDGAEMAN